MQLVLPVSFRKQDSLDTFVVGENTQFLQHIKNVLASKNEYPQASQRMSLLTGARGTGKSHLLLATCEYASQNGFSQQYLDIAQLVDMPPEMLLGLVNKDVVCIDNLQAVSSVNPWQTAIFDTINQFTELEGCLLLIACNTSIDEIDYTLLDLATRLSWGTNFVLHSLSDSDKHLALQKHLEVLGLSFTQDAVSFLLNRLSRNMHELSGAITALDKASLANKRKITIPFIKDTLAI